MSTQTLQEIEKLLKQANNAFVDKNFKSANQFATKAFAEADKIRQTRCKTLWPQAKKLRNAACELQDKAEKKIYFSSPRSQASIVRLQDVMAIAPSSIAESGIGTYAGNGVPLAGRA